MEELPQKTPEQLLMQLPPDLRDRLRAGLAAVREFEFVSPALTRFWGRPIAVRGYVALPPGYEHGTATYPTVFKTGGFGSSMMSASGDAAFVQNGMATGELPPMIWVEEIDIGSTLVGVDGGQLQSVASVLKKRTLGGVQRQDEAP